MADEKFKRNASPFGLGRSKEAQDFATRASNNLLPWIKEHYHIYVATRTSADPFTPAGLYNYHLRGDYYLGLTKDDIRLDQVGLHNNSNPTRLAHIAQTARAFDGNESIDLVTSIDREPEFNGTELYGLLGAAEDISSAASAHFFTREVANGSILTEFLFAEQATMAYKLLPYMKDFHTGVKKFLVNEALHFIDNIDSLRNRGINKDTTHNVHHAFRLDASELSARLDATGLSPTRIPPISIDGTTIDFAVNVIGLPASSFNENLSVDAFPKPTFVLPIFYVMSAAEEYSNLIRPRLDTDMQDRLDDIFDTLLIDAIQTSYRIGGFYTIDTAGDPVLTDVRNFTYRDYDGNPVGIKSDDYNSERVKKPLTEFFETYFDLVDAKFPVGTTIELNRALVDVETRSMENQTQLGADTTDIDEWRKFLDGGSLFRITSVRKEKIGKKKKKKVRELYGLEAVDGGGGTRSILGGPTVTIENFPEFIPKGDRGDIPAVILHSEGVNIPKTNTPISIIGRLLLSVSYSIFNAGAYYSTPRDMRRLTKKDTPGHYEPLHEALRGANIFRHGRAAHDPKSNFGIIDLYAELRADLMADYLAAMYDSIKGKYRDDFVRFFTGDFHSNELDFYTNAVSNYISNEVRPEDFGRDPVMVGPRLTTREPRGLLPATSMAKEQAQVQYYRTANPELIYYQIDSPLLRNIFRELTTAFYEWYVELAEELDRGRRNLRRGGLLSESDDPSIRAMMTPKNKKKKFIDPGQDRQPIRPTKLLLESMWPLLTTRAKDAVESGEVPAHEMLTRLANAVRAFRNRSSQAILAVPITTSFINFGDLLRSPGQYALPPSTDAGDVEAFMGYLQTTHYNEYTLIGRLAAEIEDVRVRRYTQDQLIAQFKKQYRSFRNTKALNRFTFPATAEVVRIFREMIALPTNVRAQEAATITTMPPPAPTEQPATEPPLPEPFRRPRT